MNPLHIIRRFKGKSVIKKMIYYESMNLSISIVSLLNPIKLLFLIFKNKSMNYKFFFIALIFTLSFKANSQNTQTDKYTEAKIDRVMQDYFEVLKEEGYAPKFDKENDIEFKIEGKRYYILRSTYETSLSLARYYKNEYGCDDLKAFMALNYATMNTRNAKAYMTSNCESFIIKSNLYNNGADVDALVNTAIRAVKYCDKLFIEKINE